MKSVNLIPAARRDAKRRRKHRKACALACGAYAAALAGAVGVAHLALNEAGPTLDDRLAAVDADVRRF